MEEIRHRGITATIITTIWITPASALVHEADWYDTIHLARLSVHVKPVRHFSGRTVTRDQSP